MRQTAMRQKRWRAKHPHAEGLARGCAPEVALAGAMVVVVSVTRDARGAQQVVALVVPGRVCMRKGGDGDGVKLSVCWKMLRLHRMRK